MTIHERMMAVYRREVPDRVPAAIYGSYLPRGSWARAARELGLGIIESAPVVSLVAPPWHIKPGYVSEVKNVDLKVTYTWEKGQRVETRIYDTPVGRVTQETTTDPAYGSDWIRKFYITGEEDYKVVQYLVEHTVLQRREASYRAKAADLGDDGVVLGRIDRNPYQKLLIELAGPEQFLTDLYSGCQPACELMEALGRRLHEAVEMAAESDAEVIWQPDNLTADMTPPQAFEEYCLPFYKKWGEMFKEAGKPFVVHMDGRLGPLKDLIAQSPVDGIESFSLPMVGGDMRLSEAQAAWPGKAILPNFPSNLSHKSDQEIEAFLETLFDEADPSRPWMLQISEDLPLDQRQRVVPTVARAVAALGVAS